MSLSERFNLSDAELHCHFASSVGHLEWFHTGTQRLRGSLESALSSGNANAGFLCATQSTVFSVVSGEKELTLLLKEIDYYLHLLGTYQSDVAKNYLLNTRGTVSVLIDKGEATSIEEKECFGDLSDPGNKFLDSFYFHHAFRNFWLGYSERCRHFAQKCFAQIQRGKYTVHLIKFYYGLNLLDMLKKKMNASRQKEVEEIIGFMKVATTHSDSNYRNKLELLEAEQYGLRCSHSEAAASYDAAISSAKTSKFVNEQGLACEKAGFYYKRKGDARNALVYFQQAHACYEEWGSRVKVDVIQRELDHLNSNDTNNT
jgi:tetratricopeptide (TPR) repeat protein